MKNSIKNIYRWIPVLFFGITLAIFTNCEDDIKFEDMVPDYTHSIMRSFSANGQKATIDHTNGVVNLILPAGADVSSVSVDMTLPEGATIEPESGSTLDFSSGPVIFTVTNNEVSREYTVTIAAYGDPMIMTFAIGENVGVIDQVNGTINVTIGSEEDIKALTPQYTIPGGTTASPQSGVINDFTAPVKYTVLSDDGFTGKSYIVTVTQLAAPVIDVFATSEDVCAVTGVIDNDASTINIILPAGSDLSSVSPVITLNDELTVSPTSGEAQDFSQGPVTYIVTNLEGLTAEYQVTISSQESTNKVVFLGEADCINTLEDDDAKAAAEYLKAQYPDDFAYIKIANITEEALANTNVAMLYYLTPLTNGTQYFATSDNVMTLLPAELQPGAAQAGALTSWVKGGGNLFLAGDPTSFIHVLGRMPADYNADRGLGNYRYTEFGCADAGGCVDYDKPVDDIWGLGVRDANNSGDRRGHPIFNGLTFEGDGELYLNNAGTREARLIWWQHMDGILTPGCCGQDAALVFEQSVNAVKLGTLRWIGDGFGYGAVEFLPTNGAVEPNFDSNISTDFAGKVITLENTIIGYEFGSNDGRPNDYQGNIEMLTSNIIDYLNN
ncbi:DUF4960 domain-containing protein [Draconibacterium sediminis]|uniref:Uncharacterized protein n=1 Tax=Draconibacterium sediminis TaxID=1544798 RepID=A0A0D8JFI6_9BACT|nr:DUF4960 domain-containing protein [Draconibacterium sediminis]KJF45499.1 hypothetical protein LH29_09110 [Draconibacterium sediminis]